MPGVMLTWVDVKYDVTLKPFHYMWFCEVRLPVGSKGCGWSLT